MSGLPTLFGRDVTRLHCVGVAGMGLGPLALYLAGLGFRVSGEDDAMTEPLGSMLRKAGVRLGAMGEDCELLVFSSAIPEKHPARKKALERGVRQVRRGELLAELSRSKKLVAICGAHGKTTTTAMLVTALLRSGFEFSYVLGGLFSDERLSPAKAGAGDWLVAEIDESDGTIGGFTPEICVPTNLDWDHPDHYATLGQLEKTFSDLFARTRGTVLLNRSCALSMRLAPEGKTKTIGLAGDFRYVQENAEGGRIGLYLNGDYTLSRAVVNARGAFNAANAAAALAAAQLMGAKLDGSLLSAYASVRRRQGLLHDGDFRVVEDYAHHPAEIAALLRSLREQCGPQGRLLAVFQPHRYSRTLQFRTEFVDALGLADHVWLLDVYSAGEAPVEGGSSADLAKVSEGLKPGLVQHVPDAQACFNLLDTAIGKGDLVAIVGAGDIDQHARRWLSARRWNQLAQEFSLQVSPATRIVREEALAPRTTMRVGGAARLFAEPASASDLEHLLVAAGRRDTPWLLLGRGSNLVIPDEGVEALVISLSHACWSECELLAGGMIRAGAGLRLKNLCGVAAKAGLAGFEFLEGIPGTLGGALRMNAGAMGGWILDLVEELRLLDRHGRLITLRKNELESRYRSNTALEGAIALGAVLRSSGRAPTEDILRQIEAYREKRQASQPREPSAGCLFRNPPGDSAGRLIDQCGLKGLSVGGARVSEKHANFIVNTGSATAADVIALARQVRERVREQRGIELEPEAILFGGDWRSVL